MLVLCLSSTDTTDVQSGFAEEYSDTNYTSIIHQTHFISSKQVKSKLSCVLGCLSVNDCSMSVFNQISYQCMFYNTFPLIDQELLPDNNIIVFVFQQTIQRKS
jgi:hypothetical protein